MHRKTFSIERQARLVLRKKFKHEIIYSGMGNTSMDVIPFNCAIRYNYSN